LPYSAWLNSAVVYDGKIWSLGGYPNSGVYSSTDGTTWVNVGSVSAYRHASVVFDAGTGRGSEMWAIGGTGSSAVYSSSNGSSWTKRSDLPAVKESASSVVYPIDGVSKILVIGGSGSRKIYSSTDGITWAEVGSDVLPVGMSEHTSVVYDNKIWVIVGRKAYSSSNGTAWTEAGTNALPVSVAEHACVVYDSKMWIIGGAGPTGKVYHSTDGINWIVKNTNSLPLATTGHSSVVFNEKIYTVGGRSESYLRTVYSFPNTPSFASFQSVTDGSENLRLVVSTSNKLLDNGANLTSEGVTADIIGTPRPQNGTFDIGGFENDIPLCWNYTAQYKNSSKLFKASGCGNFPKSLRVPNNVDTNTGKMVDDGDLIDPKRYSIE
jgi:hypothetical protein